MPITISNTRPDPRAASLPSYLERMRAGDSFFVADDDPDLTNRSVRTGVSLFSKTTGVKFSCTAAIENGKRGVVVYCHGDVSKPVLAKKEHRGNSHIHLAQ